jgi:hypothetical protein
LIPIAEVLDILALAVVGIFTLCVSLWGVIRYLDGKRSHGEARLHKRIDEVEKTTVRQEEYHRDRRHFDSTIERLEARISEGFGQVTTRLDGFFQNFKPGAD